jgi:hypothetical protein
LTIPSGGYNQHHDNVREAIDSHCQILAEVDERMASRQIALGISGTRRAALAGLRRPCRDRRIYALITAPATMRGA